MKPRKTGEIKKFEKKNCGLLSSNQQYLTHVNPNKKQNQNN